jgi:hypothetical protein
MADGLFVLPVSELEKSVGMAESTSVLSKIRVKGLQWLGASTCLKLRILYDDGCDFALVLLKTCMDLLRSFGVPVSFDKQETRRDDMMY